jgi:hypothetical protein
VNECEFVVLADDLQQPRAVYSRIAHGKNSIEGHYRRVMGLRSRR